MLSPADAAVIARDHALAGLGLLLDAERFTRWLDRACPGHGILRAEPLYLRYKPASSCIAGFRVQAAGGAEVALYAKAYETEHFATVVRRRERARFTDLALPAVKSREHGVMVRHAAGDRELPALRRLADRNLCTGLLEKLSLETDETTQIDMLRYKAERRFVGRVARQGTPIALVKAYTKDAFTPAFLRAREADRAGLARLIGAVPGRAVLALQWLPGIALHHPGADMVPTLRDAGATLASLHAARLSSLETRDRDSYGTAALKAAEAVEVLLPGLGERASALVHRAMTAFEAARPSLSPVHGDFSPDQIIAVSGAASILDWDNLALGEAAADLGSFAASLEADAATGGRSAQSADAALAALMDGYERTARSIPDPIALHRVLGLVRLAPEPFRRRLPDWPDRTAAILGRAETILRTCARDNPFRRRAG